MKFRFRLSHICPLHSFLHFPLKPKVGKKFWIRSFNPVCKFFCLDFFTYLIPKVGYIYDYLNMKSICVYIISLVTIILRAYSQCHFANYSFCMHMLYTCCCQWVCILRLKAEHLLVCFGEERERDRVLAWRIYLPFTWRPVNWDHLGVFNMEVTHPILKEVDLDSWNLFGLKK